MAYTETMKFYVLGLSGTNIKLNVNALHADPGRLGDPIGGMWTMRGGILPGQGLKVHYQNVIEEAPQTPEADKEKIEGDVQ